MYKTKDFSGDAAIKDVDISKGVVTGYLSVFDVVDSDNDVIAKGAYSKSLLENGPGSEHPRISHLYMHNTTQPIGKFQTLQENNYGLYFESQMSKASLGKDVLIMYDEGILKEHSVGFNILASDNSADYQLITEMKLWEGSTVMWGANQFALGGQKSLIEQREDMETQIKAWEKILRKGNLTDETCDLLIIHMAQVKDLLNSLRAADEAHEAEEQKTLAILKEFKENLN